MIWFCISVNQNIYCHWENENTIWVFNWDCDLYNINCTFYTRIVSIKTSFSYKKMILWSQIVNHAEYNPCRKCYDIDCKIYNIHRKVYDIDSNIYNIEQHDWKSDTTKMTKMNKWSKREQQWWISKNVSLNTTQLSVVPTIVLWLLN